MAKVSTKIQTLHAREVLDSRGYPTVEVDLLLESGVMSRSAVPSGLEPLPYAALELRDKDSERFGGNGVLQAVSNINTLIAPALDGKDAEAQEEIDRLLCELDGTQNKANLGANALMGVSIAVARAVAIAKGVPLYQHISRSDNATLLPVPMINTLDGGNHAPNNLDFQEFLIVPAGAPNFTEAIRYAAEVFHALRAVLEEKGYKAGVGDEGGFAPDLQNNEEAFSLLLTAIEQAGYRPGEDIFLALDIAADNHFEGSTYTIANEDLLDVDAEEMIAFYERIAERYPIIAIEDGLAADDWAGWRKINDRLGHKLQLVGDHLFCSNADRLTMGIQQKIANAILIKPNQVGTLTQVCKLIAQAREGGLTQILSHRHGETCDPFLASLAVSCNTGILKAGGMCRSERVSKYNELIRIEEELGELARWIGLNAFSRGA